VFSAAAAAAAAAADKHKKCVAQFKVYSFNSTIVVVSIFAYLMEGGSSIIFS